MSLNNIAERLETTCRQWTKQQYHNQSTSAMNWLAVIFLTINVINVVYAIPQKNLDERIEEVYNLNRPSPTHRRPSPSDIVTPDPSFTPTSSPQVLTVNQQNCTCMSFAFNSALFALIIGTSLDCACFLLFVCAFVINSSLLYFRIKPTSRYSIS